MRPFTLIKQIGRRLMNTGRYSSAAEARHLFAQEMGYRNFRGLELHGEDDIKLGKRPDLLGLLRAKETEMRANKHWSYSHGKQTEQEQGAEGFEPAHD